jgi:hypothetical protein
MAYFGPINKLQLLDGDKHVLSHSWIASRELLQAGVLKDPELKVLEDLYLFAQLIEQTDCAFSWRATAEWNWRSESRDNACLSEPCFLENLERIRLRLTYAKGIVWPKPAPIPVPPPAVPVVEPPPPPVSSLTGLWRSFSQLHRIPGRVRRGMAIIYRNGLLGFYQRLRRVGTH